MTDDDHREFLLAALRAARIRAQLMEAELTTIGISLKSGMISPETAMLWIRNEGLMPIVSIGPDVDLEVAHARIADRPE